MDTITRTAPRAHVRINIEKNTKGYNTETTVSLDYDLPELSAPDFDIATVTARANEIIDALLNEADLSAQREIERREYADKKEKDSQHG